MFALSTILLLLVGAFVSPTPAIASNHLIFGMKEGMTLDELKTLKLGDLNQPSGQKDLWVIIDPTKPDEADYVLLLLSPSNGLVKIGIRWDITTNVFGVQLRNKFNELHSILSKKYGKGRKADFLTNGSIWNEPRDWTMAIVKQERVLTWSQSLSKQNKWNLDTVTLDVEAKDSESGSVTLFYEYHSFTSYVEALKARKESEF